VRNACLRLCHCDLRNQDNCAYDGRNASHNNVLLGGAYKAVSRDRLGPSPPRRPPAVSHGTRVCHHPPGPIDAQHGNSSDF
jgi:hypothetical protein